MPTDSTARLNAIGILTRREIEARVLAPVIEAIAKEFGRDRVIEIVRGVIVDLAREQGQALAADAPDTSLQSFAATLEPWTRDDAMRIDIVEQTDERFGFNVTRCRYAELYRAMGIPELGATLSCNRDAALIEGFNPAIRLTRTQTIMQGAACCDFRYERVDGKTPSER